MSEMMTEGLGVGGQEAAPTGGGGEGAAPQAASQGAGGSLLTAAGMEESAGEPIAYQDFEMPEGVGADPQVMDQFRMVASEHGLSQEAAQNLINLHGQVLRGQAQAQAEAVQEWADQARSDQEIGGRRLDANLSMARKALQTYGSPELISLLSSSGLGNHPEIIRAFYRVGKSLSEDGRAAAGQATQRDRLAAMYPTMVGR